MLRMLKGIGGEGASPAEGSRRVHRAQQRDADSDSGRDERARHKHKHVRPLGSLLAAGAAREMAMDPKGAEAAYRVAVDAYPDEVLPKLYLSKAISDQIFAQGMSKEESRATAEAAVRISEEVVAAYPRMPKARMMNACNLGRLALVSGNKRKAQLVGRVRRETEEALRLVHGEEARTSKRIASGLTGHGSGRPKSGPTVTVEGEWLEPWEDLMHHALGVWHREMAQMHPMVRCLVRVIYGEALERGSFESALYHFRRAGEINPRLVHSVECAKAHIAMGNRDKARAEVAAGLALPLEDPPKPHVNSHAPSKRIESL
eukprot:PRCOL_00006792-RA